MILIVSQKNEKPFKIDIDPTKTILDLKKVIAEHLNLRHTDFNILNKNEIIDETKNSETIQGCKIEKFIRLPLNYNPGRKY